MRLRRAAVFALALVTSRPAGAGAVDPPRAAEDAAADANASQTSNTLPRLEPAYVLKLDGDILAHAFTPNHLLVQCPRAIVAYRYWNDGRVWPQPTDRYRTSSPPAIPVKDLRLFTTVRGAEDPRYHKRGQIVAAVAGGASTHLLFLNEDGRFRRIEVVRLSDAATTWPVAVNESRNQFLLMGSDRAGTTDWGVLGCLPGKIVITESPLEAVVPFRCENCEVSGGFSGDGSKLLIRQLSTPAEGEPRNLVQLFDAATSDSLIEAWPMTVRDASVALRRDGRLMLSIAPSGAQTFVSISREADGGAVTNETASIDGSVTFDGFSESGRHAVFRSRDHALRSYDLAAGSTMDLADEHPFGSYRYLHTDGDRGRWYGFGSDALDLVTVGTNGKFAARRLALTDCGRLLAYIGGVRVSPDGRVLVILTPDSKCAAILACDGDRVRPLHATLPEENRWFMGFSPNGALALVGSAGTSRNSPGLPREIEVFSLSP